jgi:hypothetical protein
MMGMASQEMSCAWVVRNVAVTARTIEGTVV